MNCELIKGYELNKKAPEVRDTSGAEGECATMNAHRLRIIRKHQSHQSRNVGSRFHQSSGGLSA